MVLARRSLPPPCSLLHRPSSCLGVSPGRGKANHQGREQPHVSAQRALLFAGGEVARVCPPPPCQPREAGEHSLQRGDGASWLPG